jgi:cell division protein FtsB
MIGGLLLLLVWLGWLIYNLGGKTYIAWHASNDSKAQYAELEARKAKLQSDLHNLDTTRGQDAAIRSAFGVARPGEEVIVVVPPATATPTSTPPWWQRVINWFAKS